jgi:hypothetical protein
MDEWQNLKKKKYSGALQNKRAKSDEIQPRGLGCMGRMQ